METDDFSVVKMAVFGFFETKIKKSDLYKIKDKVDKKQQEVNKGTDKDRPKKEEELKLLKIQLKQQRRDSLLSEIPSYLTECAEKAKSVDKPMFKVTHPVKFTHGLIPYGGIYSKSSPTNSDRYLTTESLRGEYYDITNSNGNLITHARFLMLNLDGETVYNKLEKEEDDWLSEFTRDDKQVKQWSEGLRLWVAETESIKNASHLKQNYFPLEDHSYHLTSPLFSSSMCQKLYERIRFSAFSQENKQLRTAKKKNKYADGILVEYPSFAVMNFGGTQPQNISTGNFERHGEAFLLPCSPPKWQSKIQLPISNTTVYAGEFDRRTWRLVKDLQYYLMENQGKKGNMEIRNHVTQLVYQIIDTLFDYVSEIHSIGNRAGWSKTDCKLKESHKLWLDLNREDETFQLYRESGEWQNEVCRDFGLWLNKKLEHKKMVFAKIESSHWAKLLKRQLREFERDLTYAKEVVE
ncbi:MAG: type I-F CRISPR-associated protein Csy1 [Pseudomonadales bacterium]|nr:type I-F CRISPR-associated protein Csy1 [Pseudomonadales bacterium]